MPATISHTSAYICPVTPDAIKAAGRGTAYHIRGLGSLDITTHQLRSAEQDNYHYDLPRLSGTSYAPILAGKQYLELCDKLGLEYEALSEYYQDIPWKTIQAAVQSMLHSLLELHLQAINASLTYEQSIYYTLRTGSKTFFLQHFLVSEEGDDEALLAIFDGERKLPSVAGTLGEVLLVVCKMSYPVNTRIFETRFDALSH